MDSELDIVFVLTYESESTFIDIYTNKQDAVKIAQMGSLDVWRYNLRTHQSYRIVKEGNII